MNNNKKKLYIVAGPTAVGKTKYSIDLAKKIDGEIISLDSVQVYKYLDIGSGKIKKEEMDSIRHHMIDILDPRDSFNIKDFKNMAYKCIDEIYNNGHIPILVGGTGFYINAVLFDTDFKDEDYDKMLEIRTKLYDIYEKRGIEHIYNLLMKVDKKSCDIIHINNVKRVIRAYEYYLLHNEPISKHNASEKAKKSPFDYIFYVLNMERERLYKRINDRVDRMIDDGLLTEISKLISMGVKKDDKSMQGIGYKELYDYANMKNDDKIKLKSIINDIKKHTRQYAKRQITWFKSQKNLEYIEM